jgi:uncharacterized protein YjbJ (UPF0337 family)
LDKDRIEGKVKDVTGRIKRQAGEWTDDEKLQGEGAADQAEGKVQNAWGNIKDKARDVADDLKRDDTKRDDVERKRDVA